VRVIGIDYAKRLSAETAGIAETAGNAETPDILAVVCVPYQQLQIGTGNRRAKRYCRQPLSTVRP